MLEFEQSMKEFTNMFPDINPSIIEMILRKHEGDVSLTIDELLTLNSANALSHAPSSSNTLIKNVSHNNEKCRPKNDPNCADDEKIALLIQNREFLRYLQRDPNFMRELNGGGTYQYRPSTSTFNNRQRYQNVPENNHRNFYAPQLHHAPLLINASRPVTSSNNGCYIQQHCNLPEMPPGYEESNLINFNGNSRKKNRNERNKFSTRIPNGPLVQFSNEAVPDGPLLDYSNVSPRSSCAKWAQKIQSHFPNLPKSSKNSNNQALAQAPPEENFTDERLENDMIIKCMQDMEKFHFNDEEHFSNRLKNMSRNSKTLLLTLAKKFSLSKPNEYIHQTDFDYNQFNTKNQTTNGSKTHR